jgi:hypothetical protein
VTDRQAMRIEKLLRLHAFQLHSILMQITGTLLMVTPDEPAGNKDFVQANSKLLADSKDMLLRMMDALTTDAADENQDHGDELDRLTAQLTGRQKN